jgi:branched-chain amino acid transport system permease protein
MPAGREGLFAGAAIVALLVLIAPLVLPSYVAFELAYAGAYAIAILGLIVLTGYNAQISLGHGAFVAIGGYTVAIAAQRAGLSPWAGLPLAGIVCGLFGTIIGAVTLRLTGAYLALATFALAVAVPPTLKRFGAFTGGSQGITLPRFNSPSLLAGEMTPERLLYYMTWTIFALLCAFTWYLLSGRLGRALRGLRDSEIAAVSFGIDPLRYKSFAFGWSAAYAGIAGAVLALLTAYVSPDAYPLQLSITLLIGAVIGGLKTLWGAIVGGVVVEFLPLWAQSINPAASSIIYGVALVAVMIAMPAGIAGTLGRGLQKLGALLPARTDHTNSIRSHVEGNSRR